MQGLRELFQYREMLYNLVRKDLRTRYKGSMLGFLWTFINPLLQLAVYAAVFSVIMRVQVDNFAVYLFVGLIPWLFFVTSIQGSASCIIGNKDLVKKIYFPRLVLPLSVATGAFMNMVFSMVIVLMALLISGIGFSRLLVFLPAVMLLEYLLVIGMCLIFSSLNVYFRDLEHILGIITMAWFYLTPILYTVDMIPEKYLPYYFLNPMTPIIIAYRDILFFHQTPDFSHLAGILTYSVLSIIIGYLVFQKLQRNFAEEL